MMNNQMMNQFENFMQQMRGRDPMSVFNQIVASGRFSQKQINEAHQRAKELEQQFEGIRKRFGL